MRRIASSLLTSRLVGLIVCETALIVGGVYVGAWFRHGRPDEFVHGVLPVALDVPALQSAPSAAPRSSARQRQNRGGRSILVHAFHKNERGL